MLDDQNRFAEIGKGILGIIGIGIFCAMLYVALGAACVSIHGVAACTMDWSDE